MRKWRGRWRAEGEAGLPDRSSRPRHSPRRTPEPQRRKVIETRRHTRRGAGFIAHVLDMHSSTVHRICVAEGLGRLDRGDRSTGPPPKPLRYQRENPGELVHVDIKKLPAIPDGGGWRTHGRGNAGPRQRAGWRYVHTAIDDRTRLGYSEIHSNETGPTAAGFWRRAAAFYALNGIACERVLTDNGPCYRSDDFREALKDTRTSPRRTRPLPAPDQRQSRALQPHPQRRMGLRPRLDLRHPTQPSPPSIHDPLQSAPAPRSPQLGHPHGHPHPPKPGQRVGNAQLGVD